MEKHPGTGITFKEKMKYDCERRCPIPPLLPNNTLALDIINRFASIIYNGETISPTGIEKAMSWSGVPEEGWWELSQKIANYFQSCRAYANRQMTLAMEKSKQGK